MIYAIMVTFKPDQLVMDRIENIRRQVDRLIVVDNSPDSISREFVNDSVLVIHNKNDGGMAGALNKGISIARDDSANYVFVFDQDTDLSSDYCDKMLEFVKFSNVENVGIFGPRHINSATSSPVRLSAPGYFLCSCWPNKGSGSVECYFLINSCSLLDLGKISNALIYDENMALDMIDVDFGLKARKLGVLSLCNTDLTVRHGIGSRKSGSFALSPTNYSSSRKYLQTRNRVLIWKEYFFTFKLFTITDILIWVLDSLRTVMFEENKFTKFKFIAMGLLAGLANNRNTNLER